MCDVWPILQGEQDCKIPLRSLINNEKCVTQVCIDTESSYIELFDDYGECEIPKTFLRLPTFEQMVGDFQDVLRRYVDILDTPIDKRSLRYIRESGRIEQFREFYTDEAVTNLIQYLKNGGYSIKDYSVKYEIAMKLLSEVSDVEIPEEKIKKLVLSEDNIRNLIGYVYKYIAEERNRKVNQYAKEHPNEVINCTIIFE